MSSTAKKRVLIADEAPFYRKSVAKCLSRTDQYEVHEASSGEETINALKRGGYDLLIIDYQLGEVSGLNVMQWLFEQKIPIPVVMLTSEGTESIAVEMMKLGAFDYVRKDQVELSRFPALVNGAFERQRFKMDREGEQSLVYISASREEDPGLFGNTGETFARSTDAVIGLIADEFDDYRTRLRPNLSPSSRSDVDRMMKSFEDQLKLISLFTKTLTDVALLEVQRQSKVNKWKRAESVAQRTKRRIEGDD